jgi:hypothetical protein
MTKSNQLIATLVLLSTTALTACLKKEASAGPSCDIPSIGVCIDFGAGNTAQTSELSCTAYGGTLASSADCSATSRVGRCEKSSQGLTQTLSYYSDRDLPYTAYAAQLACDSDGGTFTAGL